METAMVTVLIENTIKITSVHVAIIIENGTGQNKSIILQGLHIGQKYAPKTIKKKS